jgi:hypothetical protein
MVVILRAPIKLIKAEDLLSEISIELKKTNTHLTLINDESISEEDIIET